MVGHGATDRFVQHGACNSRLTVALLARVGPVPIGFLVVVMGCSSIQIRTAVEQWPQYASWSPESFARSEMGLP